MILIKFLNIAKACTLIKLISSLTFKFNFIKILMIKRIRFIILKF